MLFGGLTGLPPPSMAVTPSGGRSQLPLTSASEPRGGAAAAAAREDRSHSAGLGALLSPEPRRRAHEPRHERRGSIGDGRHIPTALSLDAFRSALSTLKRTSAPGMSDAQRSTLQPARLGRLPSEVAVLGDGEQDAFAPALAPAAQSAVGAMEGTVTMGSAPRAAAASAKAGSVAGRGIVLVGLENESSSEEDDDEAMAPGTSAALLRPSSVPPHKPRGMRVVASMGSMHRIAET